MERYYCNYCNKEVENCAHKHQMMIDFWKMKAEHFKNLSLYWEKQYKSMKNKQKDNES